MREITLYPGETLALADGTTIKVLPGERLGRLALNPSRPPRDLLAKHLQMGGRREVTPRRPDPYMHSLSVSWVDLISPEEFDRRQSVLNELRYRKSPVRTIPLADNAEILSAIRNPESGT